MTSKLSIISSSMQYLNKVNQTYGPYYEQASQMAKLHYQEGVQTLSQLTHNSTEKINKVVSQGEEIKKQAWEMADETADQILDYVEDRLKLTEEDKITVDKSTRVVRIYNKVKEMYLLVPMSQFHEMGLKGCLKIVPNTWTPVISRMQATLMVGQQLINEMILSRLGGIQATLVEIGEEYVLKAKTLADAIKLQERLQHYKGEFRGWALRTKDRGIELWVKREELLANVYAALDQLKNFAEQTKASTCQYMCTAREEAVQLYQQVMRRIKEREIQITTQWASTTRKTPALEASQAAGEMIPHEVKEVPKTEE